jgi:tetratricopeptide (TPR) repeat protein
VTLLMLAISATAGVWLWKTWQRRDLERRFEVALSAIHSHGSLDVVEATVQRLSGRSEWQPQRRLLLGALLLRSGDPMGAMALLESVPRDGKLRPSLFLLVGESLFMTGDLVAAEQMFRVVAHEQPDNADAHLCLARVYHEFGSVKPLTDELEQVVRLRPDDFRAYWLLGSMYEEDLQQIETGAEKYRLALERNPPEPNRTAILRALVRCLLLTKDYSAVLDIVPDLPDDSFKEVVSAEAYRCLGDSAAAQRLLAHLEETDPDLDSVLLLGAELAIERHEPQVAVPRLKKLIDRDPYNVVVRHQLSLAYQALGDTAASKAESEMMLQIRDLQMRRVELYTVAIGRPADADVRDELASVCEKLGRSEEAARWRRNAAQTRLAVEAQEARP